MTPPERNPMGYAPQRRKHWADAQEIKPDLFSIMEGSGPKATTRDFSIVQRASTGHWRYVGTVSRPRYGHVTLEIGYLEGRSWKISGPEEDAPRLVAQLIEIAREYA